MFEFGNLLRMLRKKAKLTQTTLAKDLGLSFSAISMYERGERIPDVETLKIIADYFNVTLDYLIGREKQNKEVNTLTLSELIIFYRKENRLSQRKFAELTGLSNGYISMLEKGVNPNTNLPITPTLPQFKKIANAMGLSLYELFSKIEDIDLYTDDYPTTAPKSANTSIRLKQIMNQRDLKQVDILELAKPYCKEYNIKLNKNDLSQYVSGKVEPGQHKLTILGLALNVSETWLMGYDVPNNELSAELQELVTVAADLPPEKIKTLTQVAESMKK